MGETQAGHPAFQRLLSYCAGVSGILDRPVKPDDDSGPNNRLFENRILRSPARATLTRSPREAERGKVGGRTHEIQRLIGRSLRSVVDMGRVTGCRVIAEGIENREQYGLLLELGVGSLHTGKIAASLLIKTSLLLISSSTN